MIYEYREGLHRIRIDQVGDAVSVVRKSPDSSASQSFALTDLSPIPALAMQRDSGLKTVLVLGGVVTFAAIIVISMIRFSIGWSTFVVALAVLLGCVGAAYFLTPTRRYAIFYRTSGVLAFSLKSRAPESEFDATVATLTRKIAESREAPNQAPESTPR